MSSSPILLPNKLLSIKTIMLLSILVKISGIHLTLLQIVSFISSTSRINISKWWLISCFVVYWSYVLRDTSIYILKWSYLGSNFNNSPISLSRSQWLLNMIVIRLLKCLLGYIATNLMRCVSWFWFLQFLRQFPIRFQTSLWLTHRNGLLIIFLKNITSKSHDKSVTNPNILYFFGAHIFNSMRCSPHLVVPMAQLAILIFSPRIELSRFRKNYSDSAHWKLEILDG